MARIEHHEVIPKPEENWNPDMYTVQAVKEENLFGIKDGHVFNVGGGHTFEVT